DDHDDDDHDHDHEHEHGHDEFESFSVDLPELPDPAAFQKAVSETIAAHDLLRVKGFCAVSGKPMRLLIQAVGPRVDAHYDRPFAGGEARATRLVVIGLAGIDRAAVTASLEAAARARAA
ncbi:MAG: GTP-binding protein, partial [Pseudomonadota bacterium]|nr:GTP-binding protein [Pseudomonadota bacterium]